MNYDTWVVLQNAIKGNSFLHCNGIMSGLYPYFPPFYINGCGQWTPGVIVHGRRKTI
jgi:hypothetical protein